MSKSNYLFLLSATLILGTGCEKSTSDDFEDVNGSVAEKLISSISLVSAQDPNENENVVISYDSEKRLSSITDGTGTSLFVYDNSGLTNVTGDGDNFNVEELYKSPYDAFKVGDVAEHDSNGNPSKILFFVEEYNYEKEGYENLQYSAEISYEDTPNLYYYTMEAAGLIDVLDRVKLNFSMQPQATEILKAKVLFPNNNFSKITYKDEKGNIVYEIKADYSYDEENYPTQITVTSMSVDDSETLVHRANFQYL